VLPLSRNCLHNYGEVFTIVYSVGGFAFVFVAQDLKDGKEYALKV